jgi:lysine N-acyltransferase
VNERPHQVEAWEYDWPPARWHRYLCAQLDGEFSRPFIGSFRGGDVGYVKLYPAAKDSIAPRTWRANVPYRSKIWPY